MDLFKGQLTLTDLRDNMIFRRLLELRSARVNRLMEDAKSMEEKQKDRNRQEIRNRILTQ